MPVTPGARGDADQSAIAVVQAWHDALNAGNLDRLAAHMHDDVEFGGPRGSGRGAGLVRDWAERSGIRLEPEQWFARNGEVVVAQRARWLDPDTDELGPPDAIASVFQVRDKLIQRVVRFGSWEEALATVGSDGSEGGSSMPAVSSTSPGNATIAPEVINRNDLPYSGSSHELEGYLHGAAPVCLIFFDGVPGSGPKLHRHPYAEVFITLEGEATFTVGDATLDVTAGQIVVAPAGAPHKFVNPGAGPLRQIDIHCNDRFATEWLEE